MNTIMWLIKVLNSLFLLLGKISLLKILIIRNETILNILINSLGAIGTISAVLVALFSERIKSILYKPVISIFFSDCAFLHQKDGLGEIDAISQYLRIKNIGLSTAKKLKCSITSLILVNDNPPSHWQRYWLPRYLPWLTSFKENDRVYNIDLFPNEEAFFNFCLLTR